ncbi:Hypothetical_protein [Hexamita inflata]|uniref:Hypothetical_protein n=1 Tax=Hexamita inflata TaxID=28002 RepID=A0AA86P2F0_9EUKA|nr:Hypothetical protein HINF_LOCUS18349 [Hexamita inflata]
MDSSPQVFVFASTSSRVAQLFQTFLVLLSMFLYLRPTQLLPSVLFQQNFSQTIMVFMSPLLLARFSVQKCLTVLFNCLIQVNGPFSPVSSFISLVLISLIKPNYQAEKIIISFPTAIVCTQFFNVLFSFLKWRYYETAVESVPKVNLFFVLPRILMMLQGILKENIYMLLADLSIVAVILSEKIINDEVSSFMIGIGVFETIVAAVLFV